MFFTLTGSILPLNVVMANEHWVYNLLHNAQNFSSFDVLILSSHGCMLDP